MNGQVAAARVADPPRTAPALRRVAPALVVCVPADRFVVKLLTIKMPLNTSVPATSQPSGPSASTTMATTVQIPLTTTVPATVAPTGPSFDVSPVTSVGMP